MTKPTLAESVSRLRCIANAATTFSVPARDREAIRTVLDELAACQVDHEAMEALRSGAVCAIRYSRGFDAFLAWAKEHEEAWIDDDPAKAILAAK